jgi:hypothetical protein
VSRAMLDESHISKDELEELVKTARTNTLKLRKKVRNATFQGFNEQKDQGRESSNADSQGRG